MQDQSKKDLKLQGHYQRVLYTFIKNFKILVGGHRIAVETSISFFVHIEI
jgi:hypothetical protein